METGILHVKMIWYLLKQVVPKLNHIGELLNIDELCNLQGDYLSLNSCNTKYSSYCNCLHILCSCWIDNNVVEAICENCDGLQPDKHCRDCWYWLVCLIAAYFSSTWYLLLMASCGWSAWWMRFERNVQTSICFNCTSITTDHLPSLLEYFFSELFSCVWAYLQMMGDTIISPSQRNSLCSTHCHHPLSLLPRLTYFFQFWWRIPDLKH